MKHILLKSGLVILGAILQGFGMGVFLFPHAIPSGGSGGLAILINHWFTMNMGPALWVVNFSFLVLGVKYLGKTFALWTFIGITLTSISIDFFEKHLIIFNRHIFNDLVIGSIFLGTSIGTLMRVGVSNGGIGVLALIISHFRRSLPGKALFTINCIIFFVTAVIISWKILFLALVSQWISTTIIDFVFRMQLKPTSPT